MKINIGGDFCITPGFLDENLFSPALTALFNAADYNIVNLECPVSGDNAKNKILKTGPHLRTDERIFNHLKALKINAVTLANNHLLDYGQKGLYDTLNALKEYGVEYVGAGKNTTEASTPLIIENNGLKTAIVNFCENEWSIASHKKGGANPLDIVDNANQIKEAKVKADFVIVIAHGGHEYYQLPSPRMVKQYRFFADNGADAVIGHHTHCISGFEVYKNRPIAYSLGNMVFTKDSKREVWYNGVIAALKIEKSKPVEVTLHPIRQQAGRFNVILLPDEKKNEIMEQIHHLSEILKCPKQLESNWIKLLEQRKNAVEIFSPINFIPGRYIKAALKRLGLNKFLLKKRVLKNHLNHIRCEAHRDILIETITERLK